jgi:uncharacterized protein (DUF1015 family)
MAEVYAFRGIRYDESRVGSLSRIVCAPYDVITPAAQADCYARDAHNAVRVELAVDEPGDGANRNRYTRAAAALAEWLESGALRRDDAPSLYVYEERFAVDGRDYRRRGIFAAVRLADWSEHIVLPHERTMAKPKADRMALLKATKTNLSPIMALYEDPTGAIGSTLDSATRAEPTADFTLAPESVAAAASGHRLWQIADPAAISVVTETLAGQSLYIADGHHRYTTALDYWRERQAAGAPANDPAAYVLMLMLDLADPGLVVLPTHRLVQAPDLDRAGALAALQRTFQIDEVPLVGDPTADASRLTERLRVLGRSAHAFALVGLAPGVAHVLSARPGPAIDALLPADRSAAWRRLDVAVLHAVVLDGALGLGGEEQGDGSRLGYTRDAAAAVAAVSNGECNLACLLNATRVDQIRDVALASDVMPEKSTYFWPKPPTGLVFYPHW